MDIKKSQVNNIKFIMCNPTGEFTYSYNINTLDKTYRITKDKLLSLLSNLNRKKVRDFHYILDRFTPFIYNTSTEELIELNSTEDAKIIKNDNAEKRAKREKDKGLTKIQNFAKKYNGIFKK